MYKAAQVMWEPPMSTPMETYGWAWCSMINVFGL
jgi:hypothetical protein